MFDLTVTDHGYVFLLTPVSEAGEAWIADHIPVDAMRWGKNSVVVERRYIDAIVDGARNNNLEVETGAGK